MQPILDAYISEGNFTLPVPLQQKEEDVSFTSCCLAGNIMSQKHVEVQKSNQMAGNRSGVSFVL